MSSLKRKILLFPDGNSYSIKELEERLDFKYLIKNGFETREDKSTVRAKGMQKFNNGEVATEAIDLGKRFIHEIRKGHLPIVSVRYVDEEVGYGLFAEEEIPENSFVGEYTGIVRENNRRYLEPLNNYCYEYPIPDSIGRSFVIDATHGNLTRFINHSSQPNLKPGYAFLDGFYHCIFTAVRSIAKGSQLAYNYGQTYWYLRTPPKDINF